MLQGDNHEEPIDATQVAVKRCAKFIQLFTKHYNLLYLSYHSLAEVKLVSNF
jgi:hypothetical protein